MTLCYALISPQTHNRHEKRRIEKNPNHKKGHGEQVTIAKGHKRSGVHGRDAGPSATAERGSPEWRMAGHYSLGHPGHWESRIIFCMIGPPDPPRGFGVGATLINYPACELSAKRAQQNRVTGNTTKHRKSLKINGKRAQKTPDLARKTPKPPNPAKKH